MSADIKKLVNEFRAGLETIYGPRLRGVYLFGSYARGDQDAESDVDVLVVLDEIESYASEIDRAGGLGAELSLKHGVSVSKVFVTERDWAERKSPFLVNVREEAVPA